MTKAERIRLINIAANLENVINRLYKVMELTDNENVTFIIQEQTVMLHDIIRRILEGGGPND